LKHSDSNPPLMRFRGGKGRARNGCPPEKICQKWGGGPPKGKGREF